MGLDETAGELLLNSRTSEVWGIKVLRAPLALPGDHAYLEKKAAANALELLNRWPEPTEAEDWSRTLAAIANDETAHLSSVLQLLARRGISCLEPTEIRMPTRCADSSVRVPTIENCSTGCWSPRLSRRDIANGSRNSPTFAKIANWPGPTDD
jgi:hypothetical protein